MDVLCVDQSSNAARTGVIKSIPAMFRGAEKTIIIREDGGLSKVAVISNIQATLLQQYWPKSPDLMHWSHVQIDQ